MITVVGLQLGSIVAFSIITETVFAWPGMGQLFLQSIQNADIPIMAAYLLFIGSLFVVINLVVDLLYVAVDPRLRVQLHRAQGLRSARSPQPRTSRPSRPGPLSRASGTAISSRASCRRRSRSPPAS